MTAKELHAKLVERGARLHGNRVAVVREKIVKMTKSGLYIPDVAQRENQYAAVVLIGDGPEVQAMNLQVGDSIYVQKFGGADIKQRVGESTYWLACLHALDVYVTYPDQGADLETGEDNT